jgi:hypothetical protein
VAPVHTPAENLGPRDVESHRFERLARNAAQFIIQKHWNFFIQTQTQDQFFINRPLLGHPHAQPAYLLLVNRSHLTNKGLPEDADSESHTPRYQGHHQDPTQGFDSIANYVVIPSSVTVFATAIVIG